MITNIAQLDRKATYSYADYLTWRLEDMVELIKGKVFLTSPAPAERHQKISTRLTIEIGLQLKGQLCDLYAAPFDVRLIKTSSQDADIYTVVQPDLCVICDESKIDEKGCIGSPDWIIEILSPASSKKDLNEKYNLYEENGVKEYWVVFPDSNVINQYVLLNGKYDFINTFGRYDVLTPAIFPNLKVELKEIFN